MGLSSNVYAACDNQNTLSVGIGTEWAPYLIFKEGRVDGIDADITRTILSGAGFCAKFVKMPSYKRSLIQFEKGIIDVIPAASFSESRQKIARFSLPYRHERMRLFTKKPIIHTTLRELFAAKYSFSVNPGAYYGDKFEQLKNLPDNRPYIFEVKSVSQRLKLLQLDRVDYILEDELAGQYYVEKHKFDDIQMHPYIVNNDAIYLMLNDLTLSNQDIERINKAILHHQREVPAIVKKYLN